MAHSEFEHPRYFTSPNPIDAPDSIQTVFLAGPVQGAPNYHDEFARRILVARPDVVVASPRRTRDDQARFDRDEQKAWEFASRERTYKLGVTGIWLAAQDFTDEEYPEGRAYAQTTRIEFGQTVGRYQENPRVKLVLGFHSEYAGGNEDFIRSLMNYVGLPVVESQDEFIDQILAKLD